MRTFTFFVIFVLSTISFYSCSPSPPAYKVHKLPSGKEVKILGTGKLFHSNGEKAFMFKYQTDLKLGEKKKLKQEVLEIWKYLRHDIDKTDIKNVIISAHEKPKGFIITVGASHNFVIQKGKNGRWRFLPDTKKGK